MYFKVTDTEIFIEDDEFRFHSKPYFLRYVAKIIHLKQYTCNRKRQFEIILMNFMNILDSLIPF